MGLEVGSQRFTGTEFRGRKMKNFRRWVVATMAQRWERT